MHKENLIHPKLPVHQPWSRAHLEQSGPMDSLPFELVERILWIACKDGGKTGCALSTASKYIRAVSSPMRYHSIALRGPRQIRPFLALLERPASLQDRKGRKSTKSKLSQSVLNPTICVKHLFLADCAEDRLGEKPSWTEWQNNPNAGILSKLMRKAIGNSTRTQRLKENSKTSRATIQALLTHLAPALEHLCFHQWMSSDLNGVHITFPALLELTCHFRRPWYHDIVLDFHGPPYLREQFPVLERLHFLSNMMDLVRSWLWYFPDLPASLSHVRFSNVVDPINLLSLLTRYDAAPWAVQDSLVITMSTHMKSLPLCGGEFFTDVPPVSGEVRHQLWTSSLPSWREAASLNENVYKKVYVLEQDNARDLNCLYHDWLERLHQREGCWQEGVSLALAGL
jgi:hypothetical protein